MEYIKNTLEFYIKEPAVLSLGKFDGLHLGHKYLLDELKKGRDEGLKSVVFTFDVAPRSVMGDAPAFLLSNAEKQQAFAAAGIDYVVECPFTDVLRRMSPEEFLRMLTRRIPVKRIVAGTDFRFGANRSGGPEELRAHESDFGYETVIVDKVQFEGADISSTRIRSLIEQGDVKGANALLGYPYFISAPVLRGNQIGRTIGFPTVNQLPAAGKLLFPNGVYASQITVGEEIFFGISNIGRKPTIAGEYPVGVETHIFDFDRQIYDETIQVAFLEFIRPEMRFSSVDELKRQIKNDVECAFAGTGSVAHVHANGSK